MVVYFPFPQGVTKRDIDSQPLVSYPSLLRHTFSWHTRTIIYELRTEENCKTEMLFKLVDSGPGYWQLRSNCVITVH